jgi:dTDP-4-dehydrorhamnose 3,5-epimerase
MKPEGIRMFAGSDLTAAWEHAKQMVEPVAVRAAYFADDRGYSLMNQMQGVMSPAGQINYSVQYPGVIKAWHRHALQTDFWMCLQGHLKVGVYRESDARAWMAIVGEKNPCVVIIPPPLWHGAATVGDAPGGLLYYVTHAYNAAQPDEQRMAHDAVAGFPWGVRHG